jgi:cell division septation protein DedD
MQKILSEIITFLTALLTRKVRFFIDGKIFAFLFIFILSISISNDLKSQDTDSDFDDLSVMVMVDGYGSFYTNALYSSNGLLYVSVEDLFKYLKIPCTPDSRGEALSGFLGNESRIYSLSFKSKTIKIGSEVTNVGKGLIKQSGSLYLESSLFGPAMGINLKFNFRSLSLTVKSDFELPAIKEKRLEKMRSNLKKSSGEVIADTSVGRKYHMFRFGMADWAVMSSQFWGKQTETRLGLGLGAELLGGEANLSLNYSDQYKFDNRLQQYLWRWVDNDKRFISQIQIGKIAPQTISSLYYPVIGAQISNVRTSVRKAMGEYIIKEVTQPDWLVELYINNSLVDFTKADASGLYMFKVPMVYGYTTLTLKFYGPMGEERSETKIINIPYSFLPAGEVEYRISGGILEDGKRTPFGRGETSLGVSRFLTVGMGAEYMASIINHPAIPFLTASFMPISKLMMFGEYDHGTRIKGLLNFYPGANSILELEYNKYDKNQKAILYNYLEERKASFSLPLKVKNVAGFVRLGYKQNVYANLNYNMTELLLSAYYKQFNANLSSYSNWVSGKPAYMNSMLSLSYRLRKGMTLRSSAQFGFTGRKILSYKAEAEKRFLHNGYVSVSYENNTALKSNSVNLNFKYDLSFAQTNASTRITNHEVSTFENIRGSLAFGKGKKQIHATELSNVGRGGISLIPFVDVNHNGVFDKSEPKAANLKVKINGGRILDSEKDSVINIIGLEPFINYLLEIDDKNFENLAWRIRKKSYNVLVDPNQFKIIYVPVIPVGEVTGTVSLKTDSAVNGIARILVDFYNKNGERVAQSMTESDGYFDYLGLEPGAYTARIDSVQLYRLKYRSIPQEIQLNVRSMVEGDVIDGVDLMLEPETETGKIAGDSVLVSGKGIQKVIENDSISHKTETTVKTDTSEFIKTIEIKPVAADPEIKADKDTVMQNEGHFYVQVGAFRSLAKAERQIKELSGNIKYPNGIVVEDGFYKIRIGLFKTKSEAESCKETVKKLGFISFTGQSFYFGYLKNQSLTKGAYYVGIGSFTYKKNALQFMEKIRGTVPYTIGILEEDGLFKVRLGYFVTGAEAKQCREKVEAAGLKAIAGTCKSYIFSGSLQPEI